MLVRICYGCQQLRACRFRFTGPQVPMPMKMPQADLYFALDGLVMDMARQDNDFYLLAEDASKHF